MVRRDSQVPSRSRKNCRAEVGEGELFGVVWGLLVVVDEGCEWRVWSREIMCGGRVVVREGSSGGVGDGCGLLGVGVGVGVMQVGGNGFFDERLR